VVVILINFATKTIGIFETALKNNLQFYFFVKNTFALVQFQT